MKQKRQSAMASDAVAVTAKWRLSISGAMGTMFYPLVIYPSLLVLVPMIMFIIGVDTNSLRCLMKSSKTKIREKKHGPKRIIDDSLHAFWREQKRKQRDKK